MNERGEPAVKKPYEAPAVLHTEILTARAIVCAKADIHCEGLGGPIQS